MIDFIVNFLLQMIFSELLHFFHHKYINEELLPIQYTNSCSVPWCISAWYKIVGIFLFGASVTQSITDIGKITIGRLRPNFIDVCRPDPNFDCTNSDSLFIYITSFNCTGTNHAHLKDSRSAAFVGYLLNYMKNNSCLPE